MPRYFKIQSWHVTAGFDGVAELESRCGKKGNDSSLTADELPLGEKSCETCLRLDASDRDATKEA